jgi:hypothetical protein
MAYKLYDFSDPELDEQIRLICDILYNKREIYPGQLAAGGSQGLASFRQTVGLTWGDRWYAAGELGQTSTTGVFTQNILFAVPFLSGNNIAINGVGYNNDDLTASNVRIGIYNNMAATDLYPSSLVAASAVIPTGSAAGFKSDTALIANLESDSLYWAAMVCSVTLNQMRVMPLINGYGFLGRPSPPGATRNNHISVAFTYAALPSTFPAGATNGSGAVTPLIFTRFSA